MLQASLPLLNQDVKLSQIKVGVQYMVRFYIMIMKCISTSCLCFV